MAATTLISASVSYERHDPLDPVAAFSVAQSPVQQQYFSGQHPYFAAFTPLAHDYTPHFSPYLSSGAEEPSMSLLPHTTDRWNEVWSKMADHDNTGSPLYTTSPEILSPNSERSSGGSATLLSPTGSPLDLRAERDLPRVTRTGSISDHSQHSVNEHHDHSPNVSRHFLPRCVARWPAFIHVGDLRDLFGSASRTRDCDLQLLIATALDPRDAWT